MTFGAKGNDVLEAALDSIKNKVEQVATQARDATGIIHAMQAASAKMAREMEEAAAVAERFSRSQFQMGSTASAAAAVLAKLAREEQRVATYSNEMGAGMAVAAQQARELARAAAEAERLSRSQFLPGSTGGAAAAVLRRQESEAAAQKRVIDTQKKAHLQALAEIDRGTERATSNIKIHWEMATFAITAFTINAIRTSFLGDLLTFQIQRLGRAVGGMLAPEIISLVRWVERLATKFETLSNAQKANYANMLQGLAVFQALRLVVSGINPLIAGFVGLMVSSGGLGDFLRSIKPIVDAIVDVAKIVFDVFRSIASGVSVLIDKLGPLIGLLLRVFLMIKLIHFASFLLARNPIFVLLAAIAALIGSIFGKKSEDESGGRASLAPKMGGFGELGSSWERITLAARKVGLTGKPVDEQQLDELKSIEGNTRETKDAIRGIKPAIKT